MSHPSPYHILALPLPFARLQTALGTSSLAPAPCYYHQAKRLNAPGPSSALDSLTCYRLCRRHRVPQLRESCTGCAAVNLGTGVGYSVMDVVKGMEDACGNPIPYKVCMYTRCPSGHIVRRSSGPMFVLGCVSEVSLTALRTPRLALFTFPSCVLVGDIVCILFCFFSLLICVSPP